MKNSRPVYSTASGRLCPDCGNPRDRCQCRKQSTSTNSGGDGITIWRETKGRGGKEVSVIRGLPLGELELQLLASTLKKHCGSGGTVTGGSIEIQGNHRDSIQKYLADKGYKSKLAGG